MTAPLDIESVPAATSDGWLLDLKRTSAPRHLRAGTRPVLIIPGYGMNAFIFGFHPRGRSMEQSLAEAGLEVWSVNLRGQGRSRPRRGAPAPSLGGYVDEDLPAALRAVRAQSRTGAAEVDLIGCSLGGAVAYGYLARNPAPGVGALCAIGAPLRLTGVHPALRLAFGSERLAGRLRVPGTRRLAGLGLSLLRRFPDLLSLYMNARHVDLLAAGRLVETVEDLAPQVNRDIARWLASGDLLLSGTNVTAALAAVDLPLLLVLGSRDGIVPEAAALSVTAAWGGRDVTVLRIGEGEEWYAHADLFIAHESEAHVFRPIAAWLTDRQAR